MTKQEYLKFYAAHSIAGSYSKTETIAFVAAIVGGIVSTYFPNAAGEMNMLLWQIPLAVFAGIFAFKWTFAPFQFVLESSDKLASANTLIQQERDLHGSKSRDSTEKLSAAKERYDQRILELVAENERLRGTIAQLDESTARVNHVRAALLKHSDEAIAADQYHPDLGMGWEHAAQIMLEGSVRNNVQYKLVRGPHNPDFIEHRTSVASLRAIAANLTITDLLKKPG